MRDTFGSNSVISYAEFGIYRADTARNVCELFPNASLHLFDFHDAIDHARTKLKDFNNKIHYYGNSQRYNDSYNWSLIKLLQENDNRPIFDYCFLDGAHTVAVDALNFFLCDRLLRVGGFLDFDDYGWSLRGSSLDPSRVPEIALQSTDEQIDALQVKMIVDTLVIPDARYKEITKGKIYQKMA